MWWPETLELDVRVATLIHVLGFICLALFVNDVISWCVCVVAICFWYLNVIFRLSQIFPFTPVGHRVQKEVGRTGYQTGRGGQGRQHRH